MSSTRGYVEDGNTKSEHGPIGIRTAYEKLRSQSKLGSSSGGGSAHSIAEQEVPKIGHYHGKDLEEEGSDDEGGEEVGQTGA